MIQNLDFPIYSSRDSQCMVPGPEWPASPGNVPEMQILGHHHRITGLYVPWKRYTLSDEIQKTLGTYQVVGSMSDAILSLLLQVFCWSERRADFLYWIPEYR